MLPRFDRRTHAEELMDRPETSRADFARALEDIRWTNRRLGGIDAVLEETAALLEKHGLKQARILDLGTGCADIPRALADWGRAHGIRLEITGLDLHAVSVEEARKLTAGYPEISIRQGDALSVDEPDASYDIVISTQFMHHLTDEEAVRLLREKARLCRVGLVVNDLERHPLAWLGVAAVGLLAGKGRVFRNDGPLSVLRGFSPADMQSLAGQAGLRGARVSRRKAYRLVLVWEHHAPA